MLTIHEYKFIEQFLYYPKEKKKSRILKDSEWFGQIQQQKWNEAVKSSKKIVREINLPIVMQAQESSGYLKTLWYNRAQSKKRVRKRYKYAVNGTSVFNYLTHHKDRENMFKIKDSQTYIYSHYFELLCNVWGVGLVKLIAETILHKDTTFFFNENINHNASKIRNLLANFELYLIAFIFGCPIHNIWLRYENKRYIYINGDFQLPLDLLLFFYNKLKPLHMKRLQEKGVLEIPRWEVDSKTKLYVKK
jgi:hypothetical protein